MLIVMLLTSPGFSSDDAPRPKPRAAAMVPGMQGKVEIRPGEGPPGAAELGDLLYPGEGLAVPAGGSATIAVLGAGARETIKPVTEATVGPKGCTPRGSVAAREVHQRAVAATMKKLRPAPATAARRASYPETPRAMTPGLGATVTSDRRGLAWPPVEAQTYRVRLLSGAGRELW